MENTDSTNGWVKLYTPTGALVTLPVSSTSKIDYAMMLSNVNAALAAGWLVTEPGLEEGEKTEQIGYVVRREKENAKDGSLTPIIDLYPAHDAMKFSVLSIYLNTPKDVEEFENASGIELESIQKYAGSNKIERGKARSTDALIKASPRPFGVVWKDNPKYDPTETDATKKKPKRLFVRWQSTTPATSQPAEPTQPQAQAQQPAQQPKPVTKFDQTKLDYATLAANFANSQSRAEYDSACQLVALAVRANKITEDQRKQLVPIARATEAKFPKTA